MTNPIVIENANTGTTNWQGTGISTSQSQIQAYIDKKSYNPGDTVTFYISVDDISKAVSLTFYRLGYYGGNGGCQKAQVTGITATSQGWYDFAGVALHNDSGVYQDATTHLTEAGWTSTTTYSIPGDWVTGLYLCILQRSDGYQWNVQFALKGNKTADYVLMHSFITDAVYNDWGGYSGYHGTDGLFPDHATKVSFLRPGYNGGTEQVLTNEIAFIKWAESQGYNLSYLADVDVHVSGVSVLTPYKAAIVLGHAEYWTHEMRGAFEAARDSGLGLAFLGANACYWQVRLESDHSSTIPNVTVVCYKVGVGGLPNIAPYPNDPQYVTSGDNSRVCALWRDQVLNRPEAALIGVQYSSAQGSGNAGNSGWTVSPTASSSLLSGTGLVDGTTYGSDLVGYEIDNQQVGSPANLNIIAASSFTPTTQTGTDTSHTATYVAGSGALVFATGSMDLTWGLDAYRRGASNVTPIAGLQTLFTNLMKGLIRAAPKTGIW